MSTLSKSVNNIVCRFRARVHGKHNGPLNSTAPDTLRMIPPLILTQADIDEAREMMDQTLADVANLPAAQV